MRLACRLVAFAAVTIALALVPAGASAATIAVDTTDDELISDGDCSLREAVAAANGNLAIDDCAAGEAGRRST